MRGLQYRRGYRDFEIERGGLCVYPRLVASEHVMKYSDEAVSTGSPELDTLLAERERLNEDLQKIIDDQTEPWGIKVTAVEIKDVEIPEDMQHAIARQAEAERERRAKVINAEGERQAAQTLVEAAKLLAQQSSALQLRYLQTLADISHDKSQLIIFPLPLDLIGPLLNRGTTPPQG